MVRPEAFAANPETLATNHFQHALAERADDARSEARREFDALAGALEAHGIEVHRIRGRRDAALPDEVFPNNWLSLHADGTAVLYPMLAPNRRAERRPDVLARLGEHGYRVRRTVDLAPLEARGEFVEGTGSLVLDRIGRVAYACRSPRTTAQGVVEAARALEYEPVVFDACDRDGRPVYHTNVMMSVGTRFALIAAAAIGSPEQRRAVLERLRSSGRDVVELTLEQMHAFAGNAIELRGARGALLALSERAYASLDADQRRRIGRCAEPVTAAIDFIETRGGGSVRCMLAEVHLPRTPGQDRRLAGRDRQSGSPSISMSASPPQILR